MTTENEIMYAFDCGVNYNSKDGAYMAVSRLNNVLHGDGCGIKVMLEVSNNGIENYRLYCYSSDLASLETKKYRLPLVMPSEKFQYSEIMSGSTSDPWFGSLMECGIYQPAQQK